jgi:branched-chain amino acid aminotransferase
MAKVWIGGQLVDERDATISALDRGLLSGYGLFETLRAYDGKPWALDLHYARLVSGSETIDLSVPAATEIADAVAATLDANGHREAGTRITITGGAGPIDVQSDPDSPPTMIVITWPIRDYSKLYENGAALVTLAEGGRPLAGVKTTSYAVSVAGRVFARRAGADDALFLGGHKRVLEATGSNVMAVSGSTIRTPPVEDTILPGVTRQCVIEVARREGFDVREELLYMDDLMGAEEVVLTSSLREVYPARSIDAEPLPIAGHATRLRNAYRAFVRERLSV